MSDVRARLWSRADAIVAVAIFAIAFATGQVIVTNLARGGYVPQFYQGEFGPAVLMACGHGFVNPPRGEVSPDGTIAGPAGFEALASLLSQQRDSLECSELPVSFAGEPPNLFQGTHRYLMMSASAVWKITGVSWSALSVISALFSGFTAALVYLLARTGVGRGMALAIAAIWLSSPMQLGQLPHLRDYAKAPFFVGTLCAVAWIVLTRETRGKTIAALAAIGAVLGFGFGFRTDVVSYLPLVLLTVFALRPGFDKTDVMTRGLAAAAAVVAFIVTASPILQAFQSADNVAHVAILGLSDPSREWLSLHEAPYSFGYLYHDGYLATVIGGYSERLATLDGPLNLATPDYTHWGDQYYRLLLSTFMGDMLTRAWAAVLGVLQLPFLPVNVVRPDWIGATLDSFYQVRAILLSGLAYLPPFVAASILAIGASMVSLRWLFALALFVVIVPGMTALQFHHRHIFHLEVLSLFTYGCLLHFAWRVLRRVERLKMPSARLAIRTAVVAVAMAVLVIAPVTAARAYQERNVATLFASFDSAEVEPISATGTLQPDGQVLLAVPLEVAQARPHFVDTNVLSITVGGDRCDSDTVPLKLRYRAIRPDTDFTRQRTVPVPVSSADSTRLLFPIYTSGARARNRELLRFSGVEVAATDQPCIQSLTRFRNPEKFPLVLESLLMPQWKQMPMHEALATLEPSSFDWKVASYTVPADLHVGRHWRSQLVSEQSQATFRSPQVTKLDERSIEIRGRADTSSAYLLTWPYQVRPKGSVLFVEGELFEGGLTVGIQQKEQWVVTRNVFEPGRFRVALQVEQAGDYGAVLANNMLQGRYARTTISRYGWLPPAESFQPQ